MCFIKENLIQEFKNEGYKINDNTFNECTIDGVYKLKFSCGDEEQFCFHIYFLDNINFEINISPTENYSFEQYYWINSKELRDHFYNWLKILKSTDMSPKSIII